MKCSASVVDKPPSEPTIPLEVWKIRQHNPLVVLHDIVIVLDYSILGYGEHVSPSKQLWSSPSSL